MMEKHLARGVAFHGRCEPPQSPPACEKLVCLRDVQTLAIALMQGFHLQHRVKQVSSGQRLNSWQAISGRRTAQDEVTQGGHTYRSLLLSSKGAAGLPVT